ncbi:hypothetical protein SCORR_v1c04850 [Spiroplasma corruscae]|uniref:Uncharacterized protein n=1 Tax=Spiroplasma corruscae TaxID=216934 RepID=A0A222EP40_9MOLU|nr:hypothetical protein [Spiroplasma corruscae]ASP28257.1 hypothetical protein SCORR_v1c04850 [Spiroplasma corruscae]
MDSNFLIIKNNFYNILKKFFLKLKNNIYCGFHKYFLESKFSENIDSKKKYLEKIYDSFVTYNFLKNENKKLNIDINLEKNFNNYIKDTNDNLRKNSFDQIIFFTLQKIKDDKKLYYEKNINNLKKHVDSVFIRNIDDLNKHFHKELFNSNNFLYKLKKDFVNDYYKFDYNYFIEINNNQLSNFDDEIHRVWNCYIDELLDTFSSKNVEKHINDYSNKFLKIKSLIKPNSLVVIDFNITKIYNYQNYFLNSLLFLKLLFENNCSILSINNNYLTFIDLLNKKNFEDLESLIKFLNSNKLLIDKNEMITKNVNIDKDVLNKYWEEILDKSNVNYKKEEIKEKKSYKNAEINSNKNHKYSITDNNNLVEEDLKIIYTSPLKEMNIKNNYKNYTQLITEITIEENFDLLDLDTKKIKKSFNTFINFFEKNIDNVKVRKESISKEQESNIKAKIRGLNISELNKYFIAYQNEFKLKLKQKEISQLEALEIFEFYSKLKNSIEKLSFL